MLTRRATALVPPGDAEEERLGQRKARVETPFASPAVLHAALVGDLLSAELETVAVWVLAAELQTLRVEGGVPLLL